MELYKNNTVSVIKPIYNAERFIAKALDSVLQQSYKDIEIILVDDCSSDRTEEVVNGYVEQYPQIIYQRLNKNQGAAVARNTALGLAKGRFVAFLDCDDVWCEGKLEFQLTFMNKIGALFLTIITYVAASGAYSQFHELKLSEMFSGVNIFKAIGLFFYWLFPRFTFLDQCASAMLFDENFPINSWADSAQILLSSILVIIASILILRKKDF